MSNKVQKGAGFNSVKPDTKQSKRSPRQRLNIPQARLIILSFCLASLPTGLTAQVESLVASNTDFALNLYARLAAKSADNNIFLSPYSISTCMAMTYAGAHGNTQAQMSHVFGFSTNQEQVASAFAQLQNDLLSDEQTNAIELNIANALWTQAGFPFLSGFLQTAANQYQASVNQADFVTNPGEVTQTINNWVAQETQNRIQNIVPPGAINPQTRLVLANAIYFKGAWTYTFAETNTSIQPFYLSSTSQVDVPLMHQPIIYEGGPWFKYGQTADFQALELPYGSNQLSMLLLLPTRIDGLPQLEQQLSPSFLSNVLAHMAPEPIEIFLPRFTNDSFFDLTAVLPQMGASDAFTPGVADFSLMDGMRDLYLSFVFHKAWVQVDEAGTEAAAATVGGATTGGRVTLPPFVADHPFLFFIRDTQKGNLLFMGRMANPSQSPPNPVTVPNLTLSRSGSSLVISWPHPFTPWTLQQSPDLNGTNWTPVASRGALLTGSPFITLASDGTNNLVPVPAPAGNSFFRLTLQ